MKTKQVAVSFLDALGLAFSNLFNTLRAIIDGRFDRRELLSHSAKVAFDTVPIIFVTMIALGVVIGVQLAPEFAKYGIARNIGIVSAIAMLREIAPIIGCMMFATQYGAGIAAEVANMKITEQVDALKVMKVDPLEYLLAPRFIAALVFMPILIFLASAVGVLSTYATAWVESNLTLIGFLNTIREYLDFKDIFICLFKSALFGSLVVLIACTLGLATRGGAKEVGGSTTQTVILSFVAIVLLDFIISAVYL